MNPSKENSQIRLSGLISSTAPNRVFIAIVLGVLAGFGYALIIPLVLKSIQETPLAHNIAHIFDAEGHAGEHFHLFGFVDISTPGLALAFFLVCLFILVCRTISQSLLARIAIDTTVNLRKKIYRRISLVPIKDLERIGASKLLTALNNDVPQVIGGARVFPNLFSSAATLLGLLGFLIYLNIQIFFFIIGFIIFGAITYQIPIFFGRKFMTKARNSFDQIQEGMRGLIYGAKELKLNRERRQSYLVENLDVAEDQFQRSQKRGETLLIFGLTYGDLISFLAIGAVTYGMANYFDLSRENLTGVIMVMLYLTAPIVTLLNAIGPVVQASVASRKLRALFNDMPIEKNVEGAQKIEWDSLIMKGVEFSYINRESQRSTFNVGPFDLELRRGEVTFIVGGNGSGKTTLGKILSLLYVPDKGDIYFGEHKVTDSNREACRQNVSAIYADFYLFTKLFGIAENDLDKLIPKYLVDLELEEKVTIHEGEFSADTLSDGQKKRLALLVAYLEDRAIYVFDEWAADQDPAFKGIFYHKILPSLKSMGKLVVVISHDDRYFDLADHVLHLEEGRLVDKSFPRFPLDASATQKEVEEA